MPSLTDVTNHICCGCKACEDTCPKKCIRIEQAGLLTTIPHIDTSRCVKCGFCLKVCPTIKHSLFEIQYAEVGVHYQSEEIVQSASGAAFWALCQQLLEEGYIVCGVKWSQQWKAIFDIATTIEECKNFRKSKYVYADTSNIFTRVKKYLIDGKKVLFVGLPCQVAACRNFIGNHPNLLLVDLICHGAPPQDIFDSEIKYIQSKYKQGITGYSFKGKKKIYGHYNSRSSVVQLENGKEYVFTTEEDPFLRGYYLRLFNRFSCSVCPFAQSRRSGDITLGDAWGVESLYPAFNPLFGTSLILYNTTKGLHYKGLLHSKMDLCYVPISWAIETNEQLRHPSKVHLNQKQFLSIYYQMTFYRAVFKVCPLSLKRQLRLFVKQLLKKKY